MSRRTPSFSRTPRQRSRCSPADRLAAALGASVLPRAPGGLYSDRSPAAGLEPISSFMSSSSIVIRGARTHNLRNLDLVLPRDKLIVLTGLSGSGKSSLAFD